MDADGLRPLWLSRNVEHDGSQYVFNVCCPTCGHDYSHIREAGTLLGGDEGRVYQGTQVLGQTPHRRSALTIIFDGECGHNWELRIQQVRGINELALYGASSAQTLPLIDEP